MHKIWSFIKTTTAYSMSITTLIFTFVPESWFQQGFITVDFVSDSIVFCNRLLTLLCSFVIVCAVKIIRNRCRKSITIGSNRYSIVVEYGNIFDKADCKKVIAFDECYTTQLGEAPHEIKKTSICGQFLENNPHININDLIRQTGLSTQNRQSDFQSKDCYESGKLLPYQDFFLMSFVKLDSAGLGRLSRAEFVKSLDVLWEEIDKYYAGKSVAIPILGSGITRFKDEMMTQQQLLDIIIASYKMSPHKMKKPAKLHIVCRESDDFSLNKIGEYI